MNEDIIRQNADYRQGLDAELSRKIAANEQDIQQKKENLEADFAEQQSKLKHREDELAKKLQEIDDRDNTHVRREIRDRMLDDVKKRIDRFGVSDATMQKRQPVRNGIIALFFSFVFLLGWTGYEIHAVDTTHNAVAPAQLEKSQAITASSNTNSNAIASEESRDMGLIYLLWIRFALFSFGLVGTLLYYIKWQNKWAEHHASSEFQLQQFYIDVNRANWAIESCLEWRKETDSAIPEALLTSITNGLFVNNQAEPERVIHPADELASALMGSASKLKLKLGENEMEFDKPKKIANSIQASGKNEDD